MPGSPYNENPTGILTWRDILPWMILIPIIFIGIGFFMFNSIGAIIGGISSIIVLWILSRIFGHK
ncbi:MAG TPA: hypothetical protein QF555_04775 [Candidatus Thalassarchaeaceae archaeon]|nr:hypothetical protein [Candidatus Thalassarchaeaceae archaeon]